MIKNIFSDINLWDFREDWQAVPEGHGDDYFARHFPHVRNIQLMTATGGSLQRDLFVNPADTVNRKDYNFDVLVRSLRNIVKQGLKPMIKTGNVPVKLSRNPRAGGFGVNVRPPASYEEYYDYIHALARTLVGEFGLKEVSSWSWGVLTEYENKDWFTTENESPEDTRIAYCMLYDYTVAALEEVIGAGNLTVGAHSMTVNPGLWEERLFIDHVAKGINYKTGRNGTQIDFLSTSFYDRSPGIPVKENLTLEESVNLLKRRAEENGLKNIKIGIDEGRLLQGPEEDSRDLWTRVVGHTFQAAYDARMFQVMSDLEADWFSSWGLTTERLWGGVETVSTHVAKLGYRMAGNARIGLKISGAASDPDSEVGGLGSVSEAGDKVFLMVYNYSGRLPGGNGAELPEIVVRNVDWTGGKAVQVKKWIIDEQHGNFWPFWWKDMQERGLGNDSFYWSRYSVDVPRNMKSQADRDFWYSREPFYNDRAQLDSTVTSVVPRRGEIRLSAGLTRHAVVFYELSASK